MAEEEIEERVVIDYDAIDEATGFKKAELDIWKAFESQVLNKTEDERPEVEGWVDEFADESKFDKKRVKFVATLGIYAGPRDEFNQRAGSGKAIYSNGDSYEGDFFEGKKHGQGHYIFTKEGPSESDKLIKGTKREEGESDEAFVARCAKALKIGESIVAIALEYGFLPCYHGDYHLGVRTGQGLMKCKDGSVYKGAWLNNKRHGKGMLYYVNGDIYSGQWEEGMKHGFGTYRFAQGGEYRGEWKKGVFQEGQWIMVDGNYFEGTFDKKNRPCDSNATMHFPGKQLTMRGEYKKGRWAPLNELIVSKEVPAEEQWAA